MIGAFSAILGAVSLAGKATDNADITSLARDLNNTKSITERARKSIFVYPVLFSSGMSDLDIDFDVSKFLELQYGIFTLLTVGLNPAVSNGTIGEYLNSISAESIEGVEYSFKSYDPNQVNSWYNMFSEENKDFFEEYKYVNGLESKNNKGNNFTDINKLRDDVDDISEGMNTLYDNQKELQRAQNATAKRVENLEGDKKEFNSMDAFDTENDVFASEVKADAMIKKLSDAAPTMIELKLKLKGYESDFKIPIALKANPHFLRSDELAALFDSAIEDKRLLTRIVKLTSGEISFFKDFLFNIDRIKRDQKLYESFGQHPWYQQFMARKEKNRVKRLGLIISSLAGKGKEIVSATSNYLPTASIVLTVDELERSSKMKYGFLMKNERILWSILNHLGLLCIGIYDPRREVFAFYFNGFKKPMIMQRKQMKGSSGKSDSEKMTELMLLMTKRGIM
jgi:hypothetical protein